MNAIFLTISQSQDNYLETPKKSIQEVYDSDQDTNDTSSQTSSTSKTKKIMNIEIDVQPKRKNFTTTQARQQYVSDYQKKWKTELCKNFMLKGCCRYGNTCCFAHGYQELVTKTEFSSSYKTKPCKKYFLNGYCPYGYRCQYLHHDIKECPQYYNFVFNLYKQNQMVIDTRLPNLHSNQLDYILETDKLLPVSSRLPIFQRLENIKI